MSWKLMTPRPILNGHRTVRFSRSHSASSHPTLKSRLLESERNIVVQNYWLRNSAPERKIPAGRIGGKVGVDSVFTMWRFY